MMNKRLMSLLAVMVITLPGHWRTAWAETTPQASPRQIVIDVSQYGWNNNPNSVFTLEEGEVTELVFTYGDGELAEDNPHIMTIEGIGLETGTLNRANPRQVLRFRPERSGTYSLQCKISCVGHGNLANGRIRVTAGGAGSLEPIGTSVTATAVAPTSPGSPAEVHAKVASINGEPLEGVWVDFSVRTTFLVAGWMDVGRARTNSEGVAVLRFQPNRGGDQTVRAVYAGSGRYLGTERAVNLAVPPFEPTYEQERGLVIPGLGFWLLWTVVGAIWLTYLYVFFQLRQVTLDR